MVVTNRVAHALLGISVAWMGSGEQFWPVWCHPKPPALPGVTAPPCWGWVTWPYLAISEVPRQCLMGYRTMNTVSMAVYGLYLIYGSLVWGRLRKVRRCTVTQWNLVARHCLFRMGPRYGRRAPSINRPRWFRMVCVDIRALWRSVFLHQFLWMVSTDPIGVWANMPILWGRGSWR